MSPARVATIAVSLFVLATFGWLVQLDPDTYGWFRPRGGVVTLGISLAMACAAVWASSDEHRPVRTRFELAAAGWIWLVVQAGAITWLGMAAR